MEQFEVVISESGTVYVGRDKGAAVASFNEHCEQSQSGRGSGQDVTLIANGRTWKKYYGSPDWVPASAAQSESRTCRVNDDWCYTCDRPKNDCACVENGGTY